MSFLVYALSAVSLAAFAYAAIATLRLFRERAAMSDRIARATRPTEGRVLPVRPRTFHNRPGEN